jgi:valyl-tRNA synthetase
MQLPKTYEPSQYESDIYALWEKSGVFEPTGKGRAYTVVVPPPNANGDLHIGHALTMALQDISVRYHRLKGDRTLFVPGADHAGFETQSVYEKKLAKEGKSRFDFSRESLYTQIYDFVGQNRQNFEGQFRRLGASVSWPHFTFTLDEKIVTQAYKTFKRLWDDGLIYRGERLVNYCTHHRTGFADVEVVYETVKTPLYYIKYGPFTLATTRPETKFGDTGVAVHPDDDRYKEWVGKTITIDGVNGQFEVRVVADEMVDPQFGTGVVKITPAHSFDDWEVAQRHNLQPVRVINHDGTLNHRTGEFEGMTVLQARSAITKKMQHMGLIEKVDTAYETRVGKCYKCGTVIEPMLMDQWFVDMQPLAALAIKALHQEKITFYPAAKREQLIGYLENLRDWNLSRQIAWGIPIPAFQNVDDSDDWIYDERVDQEIIEVDGRTYRRDPDVFDTWFSSSSWPYATLGLDSKDFARHYPLSLMETGGEILYPWVSRMIMLGMYVTGTVPFTAVYIHGYVMAEDGAKMSKSLGNVINPASVMHTYGSDALRMGIIAGRSPAVNRGYDPRRVEEARNFCNKLWNIARYIEGKAGDRTSALIKPLLSSDADHWIASRLNTATESIGTLLDAYRFSEAYDTLYHFVWDDLADWYIEANKTSTDTQTMMFVLIETLTLAHPFAPFVTETIWQTLDWTGDSLLAAAQWPKIITYNKSQAKQFTAIQAIVTETRTILHALEAGDVNMYFTDAPFITANAGLIQRLTGLHTVQEVSDGNGLHLTSTSENCWLDIDAAVARDYVQKLKVQQAAQEDRIEMLEGRLKNTSYVQHAPKQIVEETRTQLADAQAIVKRLAAEQTRFSSL